ncbi:Arsenate reductase [Paenibacillus larvae subsp. larvae]|uniref:Arsenate reductase n=2 Tax=Paenibacillus larvae TaxID=1464 RepID=A0A1V0UUF6_9BACL|nr:arsenate reductase [Paenibacillus larvae subsp. larvae]ARF68865.1 arsenate reductase [Paenibacillus larvae subsp. pulvifaciens]ETK29669.1 hypothetical protein ERIC1_1c32260 [Paenibacillus larvae subsp. larvae DSM 25719]PCK71795.1 thioredoxin-coupled arsenate reductase-like protein [Paenibacillus larvae subsp. larvae B-3650]AVF23661.1 Arsenate reductase [Paenibacillus larvae subsp. larvae]
MESGKQTTRSKMHWGFNDPAKATGCEEEMMTAFRQVRDDIKVRIEQFLNEGK